MSQTVVNFLVDLNVGAGTTDLTVEPRIFDFEIDPAAKALYEQLISQIQTKLQDGVSANSADIIAISDAINALNNWSKLRLVDNVGPDGSLAQTYQILGVSVKVDAEGKPLPPASQPPPLNSLTADELLQPTFAPNFSLPTDNQTHSTMDRYMAEQLDTLIRAFRAAGWDPIDQPVGTIVAKRDPPLADVPTVGISADIMAALDKLTGPNSAIYGVIDQGTVGGPNYRAGILTRALQVADQARLLGFAAETQSQSIQQVLMVDYISRGNELLFNEMSKLREAIDLNQVALSYLNSLQDLMNQKDPERFVMQLENLNDIVVGTQASRDAFDDFEQQTYNEALNAIAKFKSDGNGTDTGVLATYLNGQPIADEAFQTLDPALTAIASYTKAKIIENLNYLASQLTALQGGTSPGSEQGLLLALNKIIIDFNGLPDDNTTSDPNNNPIKLWVEDASKGEEGDYQRHLNDAITGSQSFNDTQREELRRVMFVFEEFYKSATALLSRLTQLIEKMATSISR